MTVELTDKRRSGKRIITKKQALAVSDLKAGYTLGHADVSIMKELARITMASLEDYPAEIDERASFNAWNNEDNLPIAGVGAKNAAWLAWQARSQLASLPSPAPVVPKKMIADPEADVIDPGFIAGWNACRAAMIATAPQQEASND
ncbi:MULTISPECIES: hypothetical protein [Edwardsiella]|uniref:Uncharacterized protein n=1 Tax=Edwardsiella anguillarum TaxID=1821960 RepID=A0ABY8SB57_9GAMM|nr:MULTISPECIES: hypothetical protein [Edwardsiella]AGH74505.1 hypothetical protein ETAC_11920 [Edwardsiella piscicida C07-087]UCQ23534.1 hypothetical protein DCE91_12155 [Edwardsiella piscicida]UCQ43599.1 hypothetical protein DCF39_12450 [Edwardsiella piscicida]UJT78085.1 hypothetical protein L1P06_12230 [Edwardsiella piscicida]UJT80170.1 hypothetical protein L1P06_06345 [Edwardsiella piscicida]